MQILHQATLSRRPEYAASVLCNNAPAAESADDTHPDASSVQQCYHPSAE